MPTLRTLADELCQISLGPHKKDEPHHPFHKLQQGIRSQHALPAAESCLFYKPITQAGEAEELAYHRNGDIQLKGQGTNRSNQPNKLWQYSRAEAFHLLFSTLHCFLPTLQLLISYFLRYFPSQQFPQNLTPRTSEPLHPTVKCSPSPRVLNPKTWGTITTYISNRYFHLLLWASFIFTESIVLQFSLSLSVWFLKLLYYITLKYNTYIFSLYSRVVWFSFGLSVFFFLSYWWASHYQRTRLKELV